MFNPYMLKPYRSNVIPCASGANQTLDTLIKADSNWLGSAFLGMAR